MLGRDVGIHYPDWTVVNSKWYGFSHGYYKNQGARIGWGDLTPPAGYDEDQPLEGVFDVPDAFGVDNTTFIQALGFKGGEDLAGKAQILLRQAVAAVLNETRFGASFGDFTLAELITNVNNALAGSESDMTQLAGELALWNNGQVVAPLAAGRSRRVERGPRGPLSHRSRASGCPTRRGACAVGCQIRRSGSC